MYIWYLYRHALMNFFRAVHFPECCGDIFYILFYTRWISRHFFCIRVENMSKFWRNFFYWKKFFHFLVLFWRFSLACRNKIFPTFLHAKACSNVSVNNQNLHSCTPWQAEKYFVIYITTCANLLYYCTQQCAEKYFIIYITAHHCMQFWKKLDFEK